MWQIQWIIGLIPTWFLIKLYIFMMTVGVILYFGSKLCNRWPFKFIPFLGQYPFVSEIVGVVLMVGSIFLYGGYANEMEWRNRVTELEAKIAVSEQQSQDANAKLSTVVKEKNKAIQDNKYIVFGHIKQNAARIDKECRLDSEAVMILNESATAPKVKK
jgi:hypothetical protein